MKWSPALKTSILAAFSGAGDVKYHVGATGTYVTSTGKEIGIHLVSNPSHLEAVDPVAVGRVRAKQTRYGLRGPYVDRSPETLNKSSLS